MATPPLWTVRPGNAADRPLVFNSFLKSYRDAPEFASVPNSIYYRSFHAIIDALLASPTAGFIVACSPDDHDQIYGYAIGELRDGGRTLVVHWVYTKHSFRRHGIGSALVASLKSTKGVEEFFKSTRPSSKVPFSAVAGFQYNPFLLWSKATNA